MSALAIIVGAPPLLDLSLKAPKPIEMTAGTQKTIEIDFPFRQGPPGRPGDSSDTKTFTAGENLSGHRVVLLDAYGLARYLNQLDSAQFASVAGITTGAALLGGEVTVINAGLMVEPTWNWIPGDPVFVSGLGALAQDPPKSGFVQIVGVPASPTSLFVNIQPAFILE